MNSPGRKRSTSDDEILTAIALHPEPVVTAGEIAERVGMTNAGVNKRLPELEEDGLIIRKEVGAHAVIYWLTDTGRARVGSA